MKTLIIGSLFFALSAQASTLNCTLISQTGGNKTASQEISAAGVTEVQVELNGYTCKAKALNKVSAVQLLSHSLLTPAGDEIMQNITTEAAGNVLSIPNRGLDCICQIN